MIKTILAPLDGSDLAERALEPALKVARFYQARLILLSIPVLKHIVASDSAGYGLLLPEDSYLRSRTDLAAYLEKIEKERVPDEMTTRSLILDGDEASIIVDTALDQDVDLIVMSTHGRSGLSRWMLGSVTEKVLRSARCPVLVVRGERPISKVMITLDGSEVAKQALQPGFELARSVNGRLILLSMVKELTSNETDFLERQEVGLSGRPQVTAEAYLQSVAEELPWLEGGIQIVVEKGTAADGILECAKRLNVDLIAMASHGRTGLRRWVYGSVTEKIMRGAGCSVLICRSGDDQLS